MFDRSFLTQSEKQSRAQEKEEKKKDPLDGDSEGEEEEEVPQKRSDDEVCSSFALACAMLTCGFHWLSIMHFPRN